MCLGQERERKKSRGGGRRRERGKEEEREHQFTIPGGGLTGPKTPLFGNGFRGGTCNFETGPRGGNVPLLSPRPPKTGARGAGKAGDATGCIR